MNEQAKANSDQVAEGKHNFKSRRRLVLLLLGAGAVGALAFVIYSGIKSRVQASSTLVKATEQAAVVTVSVVHPETGAPANELVLPGSTQAFMDTPIYARTS